LRRTRSFEKAEVLIAGGESRTGLAVARSLARRGVPFVVAGKSREVTFRSRCAKLTALYPSPAEDPAGFIDCVHDMVERFGVRLVIPVPDATLAVLNRYRDRIEPLARLATAGAESVANVLDKRRNLTLARELGIPCPRQYELRAPGEIPEMIAHLGFPIVMKPPDNLNPDAPRFPFRVAYARDERELRDLIARYCPHGVYPLFQECAVGYVHNLCCFAARGDTVAIHEYHSLRRFRGLGVLRRIVPLHPEAERHARAMMRALEWDGVAHLAFFVSHDQKRLWYMETNGRLWGSVQGSIDAGWDFPWWIYRYFLHGEVPAPGPIRTGSRTCWHAGDLESLLDYFGGGDPPATGARVGKPRATLQYLSGFAPGIHADVFRWSDPAPFFHEHWRFARLRARQIKGWLRDRLRR